MLNNNIDEVLMNIITTHSKGKNEEVTVELYILLNKIFRVDINLH